MAVWKTCTCSRSKSAPVPVAGAVIIEATGRWGPGLSSNVGIGPVPVVHVDAVPLSSVRRGRKGRRPVADTRQPSGVCGEGHCVNDGTEPGPTLKSLFLRLFGSAVQAVSSGFVSGPEMGSTRALFARPSDEPPIGVLFVQVDSMFASGESGPPLPPRTRARADAEAAPESPPPAPACELVELPPEEPRSPFAPERPPQPLSSEEAVFGLSACSSERSADPCAPAPPGPLGPATYWCTEQPTAAALDLGFAGPNPRCEPAPSGGCVLDEAELGPEVVSGGEQEPVCRWSCCWAAFKDG